MPRPTRLRPRPFAILSLASLLLAPAAAAVPSGTPLPAQPSACDVLTREQVFTALDSRPADDAVEVTDYGWECTYTWMADGAQTVVMFQIHEVGADGAAAQYRASTEMMRRQEHRDLEDVGDEAVWFPAQRLITARDGEALVSLHVNVVQLDAGGMEPIPAADILRIGRGLTVELLERMR